MSIDMDNALIRAQNDALDKHPNDHAVPHSCSDYCFLCGFEAAWKQQKEHIKDAENKLEEERRRFVKAYYAQESRHHDDLELAAHLAMESAVAAAVENEKKLLDLARKLAKGLNFFTNESPAIWNAGWFRQQEMFEAVKQAREYGLLEVDVDGD